MLTGAPFISPETVHFVFFLAQPVPFCYRSEHHVTQPTLVCLGISPANAISLNLFTLASDFFFCGQG